MNTLNRKNISVAVLLTISAFFSLNTQAADTTSIENSISELVLAQGTQMMNELSEQLQQSITEEINSFTIDFSFDESLTNSLAWVSGEVKASVDIESDCNGEENTQTTNNESL